jgi:hypothetical protein
VRGSIGEKEKSLNTSLLAATVLLLWMTTWSASDAEQARDTDPDDRPRVGVHVGERLQDFRLYDDEGTPRSILDLVEGREGLLYFYSGC